MQKTIALCAVIGLLLISFKTPFGKGKDIPGFIEIVNEEREVVRLIGVGTIVAVIPEEDGGLTVVTTNDEAIKVTDNYKDFKARLRNTIR